MKRRPTSVVAIGNTPLGGDYPVRIQSMANVSTMDTDASVVQAISMARAGAEYIRFTAQGIREARNLGVIRKRLNEQGCHTPLVADIHFNPKAADVAAEFVEKVRINPGNYVDGARTFRADYTDEDFAEGVRKIRERFVPFLRLCRAHGTAIRIGVNHGSLSDRIMSRFGDTPEGMTESCMEFLRLCREEQFDDVVISIKASNTVVMVRTVRLLVRTMDREGMHYPLHLGVTEAGNDEDGRIKSAVGIGALLTDGIGDTIRVSLSEPPEAEIPVARELIDHINRTRAEEYAPMPADYVGTETDYFRRTRMVADIGGGRQPVVLAEYADGDQPDETLRPDYLRHLPDGTFTSTKDKRRTVPAPHFVELTPDELTDSRLEALNTDESSVIILRSVHTDSVNETRAAILRLRAAACQAPVILRRDYHETDLDRLRIAASADLGVLLIDGIADGLLLTQGSHSTPDTDRLAFGILQATRRRMSRTEYISCPGCGRTLYDLHQTISRIKAATGHLKGVKIGIMGCIVNGPGEMADADYGYVGAGPGRVSLYRGKECVLRSIPESEAVDRLLELIASDRK
ncbi:4-hydroxy-3-methylbut-2-en-1-yl diphosphate synthase [Tannerella serpentiformis]|uniref:(E)-4-hydroxy-3-methylbut-2-enyl-diphosphate synthase n=1 Tax=Tannerella serpentiformis TaxID=712710 RepID=UPI000D1C106E|nr:(E)-4-hydroxy-3-methylbut-2-enyl-diphosphate synthase [Tannerella serpentiformis]AOH41698.2 4-hydroxy-3-methylbut-2-en-1-yl diphosphate synthase [Tannerella serpentiformis]AVV53415.1 4-hydroxy-3-methylbut-2-en-1-yl diphosphate synthase [Tannerella serpentiformis]